MSAYVHENTLFDAPFVCVCMQRVCVCIYVRFMCECVAAGCVGIVALIYSSVMGHYASCIVYEVVPEFQTDP